MMTENSGEDVRTHSCRNAVILVLAVAFPLIVSCAPKHRVVASTQTVTTVNEHVVPAPRVIDVSIVNLHDEPASDPASEKVVGTIINEGDRAVDSIAIRVDALD